MAAIDTLAGSPAVRSTNPVPDAATNNGVPTGSRASGPDGGSDAQFAEIAVRSSLRPAEVRQTLADLDRARRLQQSVGVSETTGAYDIAGDGPDPLTQVLETELIEFVRQAVEVLPPRLRRVIHAVYFEERQMQALAVEMGVTPSRVSQLCAEALGRLKLAIAAFDRSGATG